MKHTSQIEFGRPERAVLQKSDCTEGPDKWELLNTLTLAAEEFSMSHRTLSVLKALLTFLPTRGVPVGKRAIVFPSNHTLSARLSGMPESTLRRHLNTLVREGIVTRHDSPNRKRYARRIGGDLALAYGFDLSPLAVMHDSLSNAAQLARERAERLSALRDKVMALRAQVIAQEGQGTLTDETALLLRRKPHQISLETAEKSLQEMVSNDCISDQPTTKMNGPDSQNERHIQNSDKYDLDTEEPTIPTPQLSERTIAENDQGISLLALTNICPSFQSYFPQRVKGWHDIVHISERLAPMLGIDQPVMHEAKQVMGQQKAAVVILCILERINKIRNPGAYLRHLTKTARQGCFSVVPMLNALDMQRLSADNVKCT